MKKKAKDAPELEVNLSVTSTGGTESIFTKIF